VHLPGVIEACGLSPQWGGWALAIIGLFNIAGSLGIGWATGRWRMKTLLSLVYAVRALAVLAFLFAPKTGPIVLVFAAVMGLTYLSTVPPTAGLVAKFFGPTHMATLFGVVMLTHQVGAFFGSWLGGKVYEWTGAYDWFWYVDILLAVAAALAGRRRGLTGSAFEPTYTRLSLTPRRRWCDCARSVALGRGTVVSCTKSRTIARKTSRPASPSSSMRRGRRPSSSSVPPRTSRHRRWCGS
jgi:MFS family permease